MIKLIRLVPQKALKEQEQQQEPETTKKLKIKIEDDPFEDDKMNEMAYSSAEAGQSAQGAVKQYADILGKASQQIIIGMMDSVKRGQFEPLDIQAALKKNRPSQAHGYETEFISNLWLKMRDKFRKYMPKGKLRR